MSSPPKWAVRWAPAALAALALWFFGATSWRAELWSLLIVPFVVPLAHLLCGTAHLILTRSLGKALILTRSTFLAYGERASLRHLGAAFRVAFIEEAVFRGLLLGWVAAWLTHELLALVLVSLAFALSHPRKSTGPRRVPMYVDYFVFALVLGGLTLASGALLPAIVLHLMRNYLLRCILVSREEYLAQRIDAALDKREPPVSQRASRR